MGGYPGQIWMVGGTPSHVWGGVPHLRPGWGVPHVQVGTPCPGVPHVCGGTPSQVREEWYPISGLRWVGTPARSGWGYPISGLRWGYPDQVWMVGEYPIPCLGGYPISGLGRGVPHVWGGIPSWGRGCPMSRGVSHVWGVPHVWWGGTPSPGPTHCTEQHSKHLLHGGRCALLHSRRRTFMFGYVV